MLDWHYSYKPLNCTGDHMWGTRPLQWCLVLCSELNREWIVLQQQTSQLSLHLQVRQHQLCTICHSKHLAIVTCLLQLLFVSLHSLCEKITLWNRCIPVAEDWREIEDGAENLSPSNHTSHLHRTTQTVLSSLKFNCLWNHLLNYKFIWKQVQSFSHCVLLLLHA